MKTLLLVRHARAEAGDAGTADHDRALDARGRQDASEMGQRLAARSLRPDAIVSSTALRARTTAELVAAELGVDARRIRLQEALYNASGAALLDEVIRLDDALDCVMLVAHNPGLTELAHRFDDAVGHLAAGAVTGFRFPAASWGEALHQRPGSFLFLQPRQGRD